MDYILELKNINQLWFGSDFCPAYKYDEYKLIAEPRGISLEKHIDTQCFITCETICYLLGLTDDDWELTDTPNTDTPNTNTPNTDTPNTDIYRVVVDEEDHTFIVYKGYKYESYWNKYGLTKSVFLLDDFKDRILWYYVPNKNINFENINTNYQYLLQNQP